MKTTDRQTDTHVTAAIAAAVDGGGVSGNTNICDYYDEYALLVHPLLAQTEQYVSGFSWCADFRVQR